MDQSTYLVLRRRQRRQGRRDELGDGNGQPQRVDARRVEANVDECRRRGRGRRLQIVGSQEHRQRAFGDSHQDRPETVRRIQCGAVMHRPIITALVSALLVTPLSAQWLGYPAKNIPRTADGKPMLSAPAPRTADGKLDLSGVWQPM